MSLIVGHKNGPDFNLVADTSLVDAPSGRSVPFRNTVAKIVVVNPHLCLAFADDAKRAGEALRTVHQNPGLSLPEILEILRVNSDGSTHPHGDRASFLAAVYGPPSHLFQIEDGALTEKEVAWIGSRRAFKAFQGLRLGQIRPQIFSDYLQMWLCRQPEQTLQPPKGFSASEMLTTMSLLIEAGKFPEVGGFPTVVSTEKGRFVYGSYHRLSSSWSRSPRLPGGGREGHGGPDTGNFSQDFLPGFLEGGANVPTIHIKQAALGVVYLPDPSSGLWTCVSYSNVTDRDFRSLLLHDRGILVEPHARMPG